jgi:magnesium transporter
MVISMVAAGLAALGQDPAQASSTILTTVTDVVGFFTFLGIASAMASAL